MNNRLLLSAVLLSLALPAISRDKGSTEAKGDSGGNADTGSVRSGAVSTSDVTMTITPGSNIKLLFNSDVNTANVTIKNSFKMTVYKKNVNTAFDDELTISTANLPAGTYTIKVTDSKNQSIISEIFVAY